MLSYSIFIGVNPSVQNKNKITPFSVVLLFSNLYIVLAFNLNLLPTNPEVTKENSFQLKMTPKKFQFYFIALLVKSIVRQTDRV